jgi:uncharacterized membrane protein
MLKRLGELLASISVMILVVGLIQQTLYYFRFNLPIKYFIGLSEIGLIISDDLISISLIFGCFLLMVILFANKTVSWEHEKAHFEASIKAEEALANKKEWKRNRILTNVTFIIFSCVSVFLWAFSKSYFNKCFGLFFTILVLDLLVLEYGKKLIYQNLSRSSMFAVFIASIFIAAMIAKTGLQVMQVEKGKYVGTKIFTGDSTYVSDSAHYFIGKTEKFVFIYNVSDSSTDILPADKVEKIQLKSR